MTQTTVIDQNLLDLVGNRILLLRQEYRDKLLGNKKVEDQGNIEAKSFYELLNRQLSPAWTIDGRLMVGMDHGLVSDSFIAKQTQQLIERQGLAALVTRETIFPLESIQRAFNGFSSTDDPHLEETYLPFFHELMRHLTLIPEWLRSNVSSYVAQAAFETVLSLREYNSRNTGTLELPLALEGVEHSSLIALFPLFAGNGGKFDHISGFLLRYVVADPSQIVEDRDSPDPYVQKGYVPATMQDYVWNFQTELSTAAFKQNPRITHLLSEVMKLYNVILNNTFVDAAERRFLLLLNDVVTYATSQNVNILKDKTINA